MNDHGIVAEGEEGFDSSSAAAAAADAALSKLLDAYEPGECVLEQVEGERETKRDN